MAMKWTVQVVEPAKTIAEAAEMLIALRDQVGFISGRIIGGGADHAPPAAQAFFEDCGPVDWLPDGMRRVMTPECLLKPTA